MIQRALHSRRIRRQLADYRPNLYRMAYAWCGDPSLADDLVQEAILRALEKASQLKDPEKFASWCCRILHNCWLSHLRALKPNVALDEVVLRCKDCPERHYSERETGEILRRAIDSLPQGQRKVLMLIDLEGFSYREVADILAIPVGTVMSRISRARSALEKNINVEKGMEEPSVTRLRRIK